MGTKTIDLKIRHLLLSDFDGTIAQTSEPSPKRVTVESSYLYAVHRVFGPTGVMIYEDLGGIMHREPGEMVGLMLDHASNRGMQMDNNGYGSDVLTREFVDAKLSQLLPEISEDWPKLFPGFKDMLGRLSGLGIELGIISNGHDQFIQRVFEINGLDTPKIMVTSDTLREKGEPTRFKPDPYGIELAREGFMTQSGRDPLSIMFIGDSKEKDGGMAYNARVPFGLFDRNMAFDTTINNTTREITYRDYRSLQALLDLNRGKFVEGSGFNGIFLNGNHPEGYAMHKEWR